MYADLPDNAIGTMLYGTGAEIRGAVIIALEDNKYYEKIGNKTICIDEEIPFDIPQSWSWARLGFLVSNETGLSYSKDCLSEKSFRMIRVLRGAILKRAGG